MFAMRGDAARHALPEQAARSSEYFIRQPADPYASYAIKWDGEWQVTYETFRDMGARLRRRAGADLPAGGGAVPLAT